MRAFKCSFSFQVFLIPITFMQPANMNKKKLTKIGPYLLNKPIGKGAYSVVYEAHIQNSNTKYAIKKISLENISEKQLERIHIEINVLSVIKHKNIIQLIDSKQTSRNLYLVFQHCKHTDLASHIRTYHKGKLPQEQVKKIMIQIKNAFVALRQYKVVHRDLKLSNILVTDDFQIKIADFGFAKSLDENQYLNSWVGTPLTMAPQILQQKQYNQKCDIWSLGIIIYEMLFGKNPFFLHTEQNNGKMGLKEFKNLIKKQIRFPFSISDSAQDLIQKMLVRDSTKRCSFEQFFNHPWFLDENDNDLDQILLEQALKVQISKNLIKNTKSLQENTFIKQKGSDLLGFTVISFVKDTIENELMYWVNLGKKIIDMNYLNEKLTYLSVMGILDNINLILDMEFQVIINSKKIFKLPKYMELRELQTWEITLFTRRLPNFLQKSQQNFQELIKNIQKKKPLHNKEGTIIEVFLRQLIHEIKLNPQNSYLKTFLKFRPTELRKIELKLQSQVVGEKPLNLLLKKMSLKIQNDALLKKCSNVFKLTQIKRKSDVDKLYEFLKIKYT